VKLVRQGSRDGKPVDVTLRGRLEVTTGVDAHRIAPSTEAVRPARADQRGAEAFENVTVSISRPDGRKERFEADQKVLIGRVRGVRRRFYAPAAPGFACSTVCCCWPWWWPGRADRTHGPGKNYPQEER
jgi:hypothetical protein